MNFSAFYGTRRFITVFKTALHWSLSWPRWIQSIPPHPISLKSALILSCHLSLGLPSGPFPSGFPTIILYAFFLSSSNYIWRKAQVTKLLIMQFSSASSYHFIPLRSEYSQNHPILKYPHSMLLPQCQRPSFTPTQNYRQKLCSCIF
jgi:hypothetical protein